MRILLFVATMLVAACGSAQTPPSGAPPTVDSARSPSSTEPPSTTPPSPVSTATDETIPVEPRSDIEIVAVYEDVSYYGACGNEVATVDGVRYYPLLPDERNALDQDSYPTDRDRLVVSGLLISFASALPMVAPPGPGDDIGTMIVYSDGIARFESQSGWIIWLTNEERQYGWEC